MRVLLALPLALTTACGDNLSGPQDPSTDGVDPSGATETVTTPRYVPEICGAASFASVQVETKDTHLRAVPYTNGTALFMVPKAGGVLRGVLLDGRGHMMGELGQKIRSDLAFTQLSASRIDERFVVGLVAGERTHVTAVRDDLGDYRELAVADGTLVGDSTIVRSRGGRVAMTAGSTGVVATAFDAEWRATGSEVISPTAPTSMTSATYGLTSLIAWSTANECHVQGVSAQTGAMRPYSCEGARLAVDFDLRGGWMVYERGAGLALARITAGSHHMIGSEQVLASTGTSPRIAYDGNTFWASYLDANGEVVVGMLDETGGFRSTTVSGTTPTADGYDLAVGTGSASIFAVDRIGIGATHLCQTLQQ